MILDRYILRNHAGPLAFALATLMFIFILQFLMKFLSDLVGKGLSMWVIIEVVALNLAWMVVLAVPMAVLVATLMAFGNLSGSHEITAMRAGGVSLYRMMAPAFAAGIAVTLLLYLFDNDVLPDANHRAKVLAIDIQRKRPTFTITAGLFNEDLPGYGILVRKTFEHSNELEGITIFDYTHPGQQVTVTARRGNIAFSPDYRKLIMNLQDGAVVQLSDNYGDSRVVRFDRYRIVTDAQQFSFERSQDNAFSRGDRELNVATMKANVDSLQREIAHYNKFIEQATEQATRDLLTGASAGGASAAWEAALKKEALPRHSPGERGVWLSRPAPRPNADSLRTAAYLARFDALLGRIRLLHSGVQTELSQIGYTNKRIDSYLVEIYKKYSIPVACLVFVLVGAPLGVMARRGGFGVAAGLSLGFFLVYWACLIGGEKLADREIVTPFIGMWIANIAIGALGIYLTVRVARESLVISWDTMRRFVPKAWRSMPEDTVQPGVKGR